MENILKFFPELNDIQRNRLGALQAIYTEWNSKINVISRKDIDNLYLKHVLHSMSIAKFMHFVDGSRIIDVGTGGGFPGVPLAILFPRSKFVLADSVGKKLKVVESVCEELGLDNVTTIRSRVEDVDGAFDFAVSRAVTRLDTMWSWVRPLLSDYHINKLPNGLLYLKGGDISEEKPINCFVQYTPLSYLIDLPEFDQKGLVYIRKK